MLHFLENVEVVYLLFSIHNLPKFAECKELKCVFGLWWRESELSLPRVKHNFSKNSTVWYLSTELIFPPNLSFTRSDCINTNFLLDYISYLRLD